MTASRSLACHPFQRRPDALSRQHGDQDEAGRPSRQPHRRGAQRQLALHRRRRPGREQHSPLDHRERLAGGDHRAAAQYLLQHRHCHLHLGVEQPQPAQRQGYVQLIDASEWYRSLRKNLGDKNCELAAADIERIVGTFLAFEETPQSKIFPNAAFGYRKLTVQRPLRLPGIDPARVYKAREIKEMRESRAPSPDAPPRDPQGPWRRRCAGPLARPLPRPNRRKEVVVEYAPDPDLKDSEQVPLLEEGGIEGFLRREVLPYAPAPGTCRAASRWGMRSASPATSTSHSPCVPLKRSGPMFGRWSGSLRGCWKRLWVGHRGNVKAKHQLENSMTEQSAIAVDPRDALQLKLAEPDVSPEQPWQDDELGREQIAERLTNLIRNQQAPFIISINGQWGTGKTFLLKRWQKDLGKDQFRAIYYNAWEDDFCDDPLLSIIGQCPSSSKRQGQRVDHQVGQIAGQLIKQNLIAVPSKLTGLESSC